MKERDIANYMDTRLAMEIEKVEFINNQAMQMMKAEAEGSGLNPEQMQKEVEVFMKKLQDRQSKILSPAQIEKKYAKYKSLKERTMHKLLQAIAVKNNLK